MHSNCSDGRLDPSSLLRACANGKLDVVALTDHDLPSSIEPGWHEVEDHEVFVVAGAEVSGVHEGFEYHLLVYFPADVPEAFRSFCQEQCVVRAERYTVAVERLGLPDVPAAPESAKAGHTAITRWHLAKALVDLGRAASIHEAFRGPLAAGGGIVPPVKLPFVDAIATARSMGALTSWAHPPLGGIDAHLSTFVAAGLQGLEATRPRIASNTRKRIRNAARRHGLYVTAGSDWHGWREPGGPGTFFVHTHEVQGFVDALTASG